MTERFADIRGFSLIEVVIASGLLAGSVLTVAQLFATASEATAGARATGEAAVLAWQKIEQLRSLAFGRDAAGQPIDDTESDTAAVPERAAGGSGLRVGGALDRDADGWVDFLDGFGQPLGGGAVPPAGARYRRRWAVSGAGPDLLVLRARVLPVGRDTELAVVVTLRARKAP
jgi:type II secretory pathway pseudopilin PulG